MLQRKARENYQNLSEKEKTKNVRNVTKKST